MRFWRFAKWWLLAQVDDYPDFGLYRTLVHQESLGRAQIEALRLEKTRRLVDECLRHVPYYGRLLRDAGLSADSVRGPHDLERLPLLDKELIRRHGSAMLNESAPAGSYFPHTTGGSTGMPLDFQRGWAYTKLAAAANMRAFRRMGWRPGDTLARVWAPHELEAPSPGLASQLRRRVRLWLQPPEILFNSYATGLRDMEGWLVQLRERKPRFFYGYASTLSLFARFLAERDLRFEHVQGIASTALALFPSDRKMLQAVFPNATIIDVYGSREVPGIATECRLRTMHVNDDLVHVEFLPIPEQPGRYKLVVTALDNLTFPFIRYDIGDVGAPLAASCGCGLPFSAMDWGFGKVLDTFVSPEGRLMTGGFFEDLMYGVAGVHAYQFRQRTDLDITLYIVPTERFGAVTEAHLLSIEQQIRTDFSSAVRLRVELVDAIPLTPSGKHQFVVSEVANDRFALSENATSPAPPAESGKASDQVW